MKQVQKGFTLIELMIVVAIIGILAAVAIPAYQDYVVKSKLAKVTGSTDSIKTAIALYYQEQGSFPIGTATATAATGTPIATLAGANSYIWSSLGISQVTLPAEIAKLTYTGSTSGDNYGLGITFQKVRATTIDNKSVAFGPVTGNTVAADGTVTLASGVSGGMTSLPTIYSCTPGMDIIALKYFNNAGIACPTN